MFKTSSYSEQGLISSASSGRRNQEGEFNEKILAKYLKYHFVLS